MRTLEWVDDHIDVVDQTALPQWRRVRLETVDDVVDADRIATARPTAVNLSHGVQAVLPAVERGPDAVLVAARQLLEDDARACAPASSRPAPSTPWSSGRTGSPPTSTW